MELTRLEAAVLEWFAMNFDSPNLREQLQHPVVTNREFTGAGSFTTFSASDRVPPLDSSVRLLGTDGPLDGPEVTGPGLPERACTLLWFTDRRASLLEIAGRDITHAHPETFELLEGRANADA